MQVGVKGRGGAPNGKRLGGKRHGGGGSGKNRSRRRKAAEIERYWERHERRRGKEVTQTCLLLDPG